MLAGPALRWIDCLARAGKNQALGGYVLPEAGYNYDSLERHLTLSDRFVFTPNLMNQFQLMYERNSDQTVNVTDAPQTNVQGAFVGGANAAQLSTENNVDIRDAITWSHGGHTVKAGIAIPNLSRRALDDFTNRQGTYNFATLQDYEDGIPYSLTRQTGQDRFVFWWKEVGWFVQDQIRVGSNLTLAFGVRWDWQNYLGDDNNFAPRLSAAYAFGSSRKTVLRAGSGIFYDRTGQRPIASVVRYSAPAEENLLLVNPVYRNPLLSESSLLPTSPRLTGSARTFARPTLCSTDQPRTPDPGIGNTGGNLSRRGGCLTVPFIGRESAFTSALLDTARSVHRNLPAGAVVRKAGWQCPGPFVERTIGVSYHWAGAVHIQPDNE